MECVCVCVIWGRWGLYQLAAWLLQHLVLLYDVALGLGAFHNLLQILQGLAGWRSDHGAVLSRALNASKQQTHTQSGACGVSVFICVRTLLCT